MRTSGCIINDIWDRKIDALVERTKDRPLASGALKVWQALILLIFFLLIGLIVFLELNYTARLISLYALGLAILYPLTKRFFFLPQLFLGITFNLGALIGWATIVGDVGMPAIFLYIAGIFWTLGYDTIYGHQDIKDDKNIGIKSTSITFGKNSALMITSCYLLTYIFLSMACIYAGNKFGVLTLIPTLINLIRQIFTLDLKDPQNCASKFKWNAYATGFLITLGIYLAKFFEL